jgi:hypothetical protein
VELKFPGVILSATKLQDEIFDEISINCNEQGIDLLCETEETSQAIPRPSLLNLPSRDIPHKSQDLTFESSPSESKVSSSTEKIPVKDRGTGDCEVSNCNSIAVNVSSSSQNAPALKIKTPKPRVASAQKEVGENTEIAKPLHFPVSDIMPTLSSLGRNIPVCSSSAVTSLELSSHAVQINTTVDIADIKIPKKKVTLPYLISSEASTSAASFSKGVSNNLKGKEDTTINSSKKRSLPQPAPCPAPGTTKKATLPKTNKVVSGDKKAHTVNSSKKQKSQALAGESSFCTGNTSSSSIVEHTTVKIINSVPENEYPSWEVWYQERKTKPGNKFLTLNDFKREYNQLVRITKERLDRERDQHDKEDRERHQLMLAFHRESQEEKECQKPINLSFSSLLSKTTKKVSWGDKLFTYYKYENFISESEDDTSVCRREGLAKEKYVSIDPVFFHEDSTEIISTPPRIVAIETPSQSVETKDHLKQMPINIKATTESELAVVSSNHQRTENKSKRSSDYIIANDEISRHTKSRITCRNGAKCKFGLKCNFYHEDTIVLEWQNDTKKM